MKFIQHPTNNDVLRPPPGVPIEVCRPLPITRLTYEDGSPAVASFWQPSADEVLAIARGEPVRLEFQGRTHSPVYVGVGDFVLPDGRRA